MNIQLASTTGLQLREMRIEDAPICGRICFEAFDDIARRHNFPGDFPGPDEAIGLMQNLAAHPGCYGVVAELDGRIVGSNFLDERSAVVGVGPITIDPGAQNHGIGRALMQDVLMRARAAGAPGIRLVQAGYHGRSLALYASLGFVPRGALACMQGGPVGADIPGHRVRAAHDGDRAACDALCQQVHGHDRSGELADAIAAGTARVVESAGRLTAYATDLGFFGHAVAETNAGLEALIGAAPVFGGPGILVPLENGELLRWCLAQDLEIVQPMNLMSIGLYNQPRGAWLPSVLF